MPDTHHSTFQKQIFERRRQEIVEASLAVFEERGCFGFRVEDVAAQAGVAKGSVYAHFDSRTEILQSAVEQMENEVIADYRRKAKTLPQEAPLATTLALIAGILLNPDRDGVNFSVATLRRLSCAVENCGRSAESKLISELIVPLIQDGQRQGLLRSSISAMSLAHLFIAILSNSFIREMTHGSSAGAEQVSQLMVDFFLRGARRDDDPSLKETPAADERHMV